MNNAKTRVQTDFEEAFRFNCGNEHKSESIFAFHCSRMNKYFVVFLLQKCVKISSKCEEKHDEFSFQKPTYISQHINNNKYVMFHKEEKNH